MKKIIFLAVFVLPFYFCYVYAQVVCLCDNGITDGCYYNTYQCIDKETGSCTCSNDINCLNKVAPVCPKPKKKKGCIKKC